MALPNDFGRPRWTPENVSSPEPNFGEVRTEFMRRAYQAMNVSPDLLMGVHLDTSEFSKAMALAQEAMTRRLLQQEQQLLLGGVLEKCSCRFCAPRGRRVLDTTRSNHRAAVFNELARAVLAVALVQKLREGLFELTAGNLSNEISWLSSRMWEHCAEVAPIGWSGIVEGPLEHELMRWGVGQATMLLDGLEWWLSCPINRQAVVNIPELSGMVFYCPCKRPWASLTRVPTFAPYEEHQQHRPPNPVVLRRRIIADKGGMPLVDMVVGRCDHCGRLIFKYCNEVLDEDFDDVIAYMNATNEPHKPDPLSSIDPSVMGNVIRILTHSR